MTRINMFGGSFNEPSSLREIQALVTEWHKQRFPNPEMSYMALKVCEESGEVASAVIGLDGLHSATGSGDAPKEIADVLITLLALLGRFFPEVDLEAEIVEKLAVLNDRNSDHRASLQ